METTKDQQYLMNHGWRLITTKKQQYGYIYYWDHDDHRCKNGLWWTQGDALRFQRKIEKCDYGGNHSAAECKCDPYENQGE